MFDLAINEDGAIVSDRADYCLAQRDAWLAIAAKCARTIGKERGYRLAVSRAGVWARRAQSEYRSEVTRSQRITLARWEVEATRYDARADEITAVQIVGEWELEMWPCPECCRCDCDGCGYAVGMVAK